MQITFDAHGLPVAQGSKRAFRRGSKIVLVESSAATLGAWRDAIASAGQASRAWCDRVGEEDGLKWSDVKPAWVTMEFRIPRPKSHYTARGDLRPSAPRRVAKKPDLDKLIRAVLDALTGVLWADDSQVYGINAEKLWGVPGVTVTVAQ